MWQSCSEQELLTAGHHGASVVVLEAALKIGTCSLKLRALSSLGHVYTAIGDYPNALASHKQCVLLAKQSKDELSEARELGNMGAVYIAMGDFENAVQSHPPTPRTSASILQRSSLCPFFRFHMSVKAFDVGVSLYD
uniref:Tetratricopeptide repeat protein 28 n=1 Tax=Sus scrofa TaxID=9823 RepID=A0A8D0P6W2_PIG